MINRPLRLRLRKVDRASWATTGNPGLVMCSPSKFGNNKAYTGDPCILEFENPLNGSWHPVEVYDDTSKEDNK